MKPDTHLFFSLIKSVLRIIAGVSLMGGDLQRAGVFIVLAEVCGVLEEINI